jgi:hypothetical protein
MFRDSTDVRAAKSIQFPLSSFARVCFWLRPAAHFAEEPEVIQ